MSTEVQTEIATPMMVGLAEFAVSQDPTIGLCSYPLGACLGVTIYDPVVKVGGLLHSLLPASSIDPVRAANRPGMFLDTGLTAMLARAHELNAKDENLLVCVAGGAQIMDDTSHFNIGKRNYDVLVELLKKLNLKISAEDVGGRTNRSIQLNISTGYVRLKFSGQPQPKTLCKP
ncbi:MAG TPA: chemotaxis protein CheD [Verrucomicrobiae bacterium]|jgi:chemotaxis protein CheD|nr:chemotaxis protein CheD [Verrucomicrobiae bacterium]